MCLTDRHGVQRVPGISDARNIGDVDRGDVVICAVHWQGQGKTSGISIDVHQFDLYEFHEGRVVRVILGFRSKNEALEAVGVRE